MGLSEDPPDVVVQCRGSHLALYGLLLLLSWAKFMVYLDTIWKN
jgi:hypothetical protein